VNAFPPAEIHFSALKLIGRSPAHFRQGVIGGFEPTREMDVGSLIHALALGGDVIVFEGDRKGNAWKHFERLVGGAEHFVYDGSRKGKQWDWAKADAGSRLIVSSEDVERAARARELQAARRAAGKHDAVIVTRAEHELAQGCVEALLAHDDAAELLAGEHEASLRWEYLGRPCAGRLDVLTTAARRITELKMTTSSEPDWFIRNAMRLGYHAQLEWYAEGARYNGWRIDQLCIVAVEPRPPFAITTMEATPRMVEEGRRQMRIWMERLLSCEQADSWPPYVQSRVPFDPPERFELDFGEAA
jgi:hypothetical protein